MNVMIEGEPAVRHLNLVTHNHAGQMPPNTPPTPWLSTMNVPGSAAGERRLGSTEGEILDERCALRTSNGKPYRTRNTS